MSEENVANNTPEQLPKGMSIAGMVLGICGCVFSLATCTLWVGLVLSVIGVVISGVAMKNCSDGKADGKGMAIAGLVTAIVGIGWCIYIIAIAASISNELENSAREFERLYDKYNNY